MANKKLPYKRITVYRAIKTGRLVSKSSPIKKTGSYRYISNLTGKTIAKWQASKNPKTQALRENYNDITTIQVKVNGRWVEKKKKIKGLGIKRAKAAQKYINEQKKLTQNPMEESPGLRRYFRWLRDKENKHTHLFAPLVKAYGGDPADVARILDQEEE